MRNFYNKARQFLGQPYPYEAARYGKLRVILSVSAFVFLFLVIFQPFGLTYLGSEALMFRVGENVTFIFLVLCFNILFLPRIFKDFFSDQNWTIFKNVMFALFNFAVIGFVGLFYANLRGSVPITFGNFIHFEFYTLLIGGFPVAFLVLLSHVHILTSHLKTAENLNRRLERDQSHWKGQLDPAGRRITLTSENGKDVKTMDVNSTVLFESAENYAIIFTEQGNEITKNLLRSSLTRIEEALKEYPEFFRCHRTYIINMRKIKAVAGNSQGYKLKFDKLSEQIPVARGHVKKFNQRMAAFARE